jgi:hypothetical protein
MANNSEEGQGPQRAVVPVMMMMMSNSLSVCKQNYFIRNNIFMKIIIIEWA